MLSLIPAQKNEKPTLKIFSHGCGGVLDEVFRSCSCAASVEAAAPPEDDPPLSASAPGLLVSVEPTFLRI